MSGIEWRSITPEQLIQDIENIVQRQRENKYDFQVGLRDLDFDINQDKLKALGMSLPFTTVSQSEQALRGGAITPTTFIEDDSTQHQILVFDHQPVGVSGFMDCVTHSLVLTNHGLFEVGRYPALSLNSQQRYWQWFLDRRLATSQEVNISLANEYLTPEQYVKKIYQDRMGY